MQVSYSSVILVNGAWTVWTPMPGPEGECSPGCRVRTRKMVRYCTNPIPQNGGRNCTGAENSTQICLSEQCQGVCYIQIANFRLSPNPRV